MSRRHDISISIGVFNEEGYQNQVQQSVITVSQGDMVILEVWRVMQVEGRKLSSRWSFNVKLERHLIVRWSFKKYCNGI